MYWIETNANEAKMLTSQSQTKKMTTQQWKGLVHASNSRWQWSLKDKRSQCNTDKKRKQISKETMFL